MNTKIKNKKLMGVLLVILTVFMALGAFLMTPMTASAATSSSPTYTTYGSYDIGDGSVSGYLSEYKIYMHSSSTTGSTGTIYNNRVLNWTYVYIKMDATDVDEHVSFKLTRNGSGCILSPCFFNLYTDYIMRNAGLEEAQAGVKIARRNINNLRYADDTTLWKKVKRS